MREWAAMAMIALAGMGAADPLQAQAPPPPPPLGAAPVPPQNPQTPAKIALGKALFWEEQLSLTGTVACGTCHRPDGGGADPRSAPAGADARHPGPDGLAGSADDIVGAMGVPAHAANGGHAFSPVFGYAPQVGTRASMSAINAAFSSTLFWDGRAGGTFLDPLDGALLIAGGAALENQALGPVVNAVEMSPADADLNGVGNRIAKAVPLVLADSVPVALQAWIAGRDYPALFAEVFGSPDITAARIAMAIASYERTLVSNQTPLDSENGGTPSLTDLERQGRQVFVANDCAACHAAPVMSDNQFHYIGVRPVADDAGRFAVTAAPVDRGAMRTPSLRNVALRTSLMHNGRFSTLEEVVEFYNRGGDFAAPNKDVRVRPRGLTQGQKTALLAFLRRPLTDLRVVAESAPFDRPTLYAESDRVPRVTGDGRAGSGGVVPIVGALEPPLPGSRFTVTLERAAPGAAVRLALSLSDPGLADHLPGGDVATVDATTDSAGRASIDVALATDPATVGAARVLRIYVADPAAEHGLSVSRAVEFTVFGSTWTVFGNAFE